LQLPDLGGQRRLADKTGCRGTAEMLVFGQRHQVLQVTQIHGGLRSGRGTGKGAGAVGLPLLCGHVAMAQAVSATAVATAGAELRIRWSNALSAAVEPAPMAMMICLYGTVVQSPAANTPGTLVWPRSSIRISPRLLSSTVPLSHSVLGSRPICTKMPSSSTRCESPPVRSV